MKINIEEIERLVRQQVGNNDAETLLVPLRELAAQRRYGLIWEEPKSGAYEEEHAEQALLENFPFLTELSEQAIVENEEAPTNLLIEGDNLHALQALQYSHAGLVDVIYIDPPYNTGKKDFVYNDRFVDIEDSWRHSSWLSFMNKRLRLAKELLCEEGVIFLSIDENEHSQLKLLCDEVFNEANFIADFVWQKKKGGGNDSIHVATEHEYILLYAKNKADLPPFFGDYEEEYLKRYKEEDEIGRFYWDTFKRKSGKQYYPITMPDGTVLQYDENGNEISWLRSEERFYRDKEDGEVRFFKGRDGWSVHFKQRLPKGKKPRSIISTKGTTASGSEELLGIFKRDVFDNPKPTTLVKYLLNMTDKKDAIVLDFFAGSGTTGHAVMALNNIDGGNRQFILVTNNEVTQKIEVDYLIEKGIIESFTGRKGTKLHKEHLNEIKVFKETEVYKDMTESDEYKALGIARAVTYQRIKHVINGYTTTSGDEFEGLANNLRYFTVNLKKDSQDDDYNAFSLIGETLDIIRIKENLYNHQESLTIEGVPVVRLTNEDKEILVVLSIDVLDEEISAIIEKFEESGKQRTIYTSYEHYPYQNIRHKGLPKEILRALKMKEMN